MAKQTEAQKKAVLKYRHSKVKYLQLQYTIEDFRIIDAYCKHINSPLATWVKELIEREIESDNSFTYVPGDENDESIKWRNKK
jgi:hypothetical protein